jgi:hypothetical protein
MAWTNTSLWKELKSRPADPAMDRSLSVFLDKAEMVLSSAQVASTDFTLHDEAHSFRVAERMHELMPQGIVKNLSNVEIALLLLSAYCHDIGMSPGLEIIRAHRKWLYGDREQLNDTHAGEFQRWLDANYPDVAVPLLVDDTASHLAIADRIIGFYARDRHNDWSEEWIRKNLNVPPHTLYGGWIDDLASLCTSHHVGLDGLRSDRFDARIVGSLGQPLNLRYLACILRVADVLEFDPERTPDVIFNHHSIDERSKIYWHKDHAISFHVEPIAGSMTFAARTPNALIHKAVLMTADWVDAELAICSTLDKEGAFLRGKIPPNRKSEYIWRWSASLDRDIKEQGDRFVFVEGSFQPNTSKLLALLAGTALYRDKRAAIRELLQNALDAVKEQISYERLASSPSVDPESRGASHVVQLSLVEEGGERWIYCTDDGCGMNKSTIEHHVLQSGNKARIDRIVLDRSARQSGFRVHRSGQFGIGLLSYFMIADRVQFDTMRTQDAGDSDGSAWSFQTDGLNAIGELSRIVRHTRGTAVRLLLKKDFIAHDKWQLTIAEYIKEIVVYAPCKIQVVGSAGELLFALEPGWGDAELDLEEMFSSRVDYSFSQPLVSNEVSVKQSEAREWHQTLLRTLQGSLERHSEISVPFGPGENAARVWVPYVRTEDGPSLLPVSWTKDGKYALLRSDEVVFKSRPVASYRGFRSSWGRGNSMPFSTSAVYSQMDFRDHGSINLSRDTLDVEGADFKTVAEAQERALRVFLSESKNSKFHNINLAIARAMGVSLSPPQKVLPIYWLFGSRRNMSLQEVPFPAFAVDRVSYLSDGRYVFVLDGNEQVGEWPIIGRSDESGLSPLSLYGGGKFYPHAERYSPDIACPIICWGSEEEVIPLDGTIRAASSEFPPELNSVVAVRARNRYIFNEKHAFVQANGTCDADFSAGFVGLRDTLETIEQKLVEASKTPEDVMRFALANASKDTDFWIALYEQLGSYLAGMQKMLTETYGASVIVKSRYDYNQKRVAYDFGHLADPNSLDFAITRIFAETPRWSAETKSRRGA